MGLQNFRARVAGLSGVLVLAGLACANGKEIAPSPEPAPSFDPSTFVICRSQPGVSEYTYGMSLKASDKVIDLVRPPIDESATVSVRLDEEGRVISAEAVEATAPGFGPVAAAAVELAAPYPPPPEELERCITGKSLIVQVDVHADAYCENLDDATGWVLAGRDRIVDLLRSPAYRAEPGSGYAFLRFRFGPDGEVLESQVNKSPSPELTNKIERALEEAKPFGRPPDWADCFEDRPITLKIEVLSESP